MTYITSHIIIVISIVVTILMFTLLSLKTTTLIMQGAILRNEFDPIRVLVEGTYGKEYLEFRDGVFYGDYKTICWVARIFECLSALDRGETE